MADLESYGHVFDPGNNLFTVIKISGQTPGVIKNKKRTDYADMGLSTEFSASSTSTIRCTFFHALANFYFQALEKYSKHHHTSSH